MIVITDEQLKSFAYVAFCETERYHYDSGGYSQPATKTMESIFRRFKELVEEENKEKSK